MDEEMEMMMGGEMEEMMEMEMGGMEEEMEMMGDSMMGGGGAGWRFSADHDFGLRPAPTTDKKNPVPQVGWFIAGTAVVAHKAPFPRCLGRPMLTPSRVPILA